MVMMWTRLVRGTCALAVCACVTACSDDAGGEAKQDASQPDGGTGSCTLRYPIVLSHHWGIRKICPDGTDPSVCEAREPARYCVRDEQTGACTFRVTDAELSLPPRNENRYDPTLKRDLSAYHRYYSKEVVERLESCQNRVFLSDKPPFASYAVRARSLRKTVLEALGETGADKVILIGMSQGVQDARWLVAEEPGMREVVAAVVGMAGEDQGAGSASYYFNTRAQLLGTNWEDPTGDFTWDPNRQSPENLPDGNYAIAWDGLWQREDSEERVLIEGADPNDPLEVGFDEAKIYRHLMASMTVLSQQYMGGFEWPGDDGWTSSYPDLVAFTGVGEGFSAFVEEADERNNGVLYLSYAAEIRSWDEDAWGKGFDRAPFDAMREKGEANDGYASVASQRFDTRRREDGKPYENFEHVHTLSGTGRGYHHMFFGGRNDALYGPGEEGADPVYGATAADFYERVLKDLVARGL